MPENKILQWAGLHPLEAAGRALWVLLNTLLAAAGGAVLAYGPLEGGWPLMTLFGLLAGGLIGGLWLRQQLAVVRGAAERARSLRIVLLTATFSLLAAIGLLVLFQLSQAGLLALPGQSRSQNFERLWQALDHLYPYFEEKDIDWQAAYDRYHPAVQAAQDDQAYQALIAQMLAELGDAHTGLSQPGPNAGRHYFGTALLLDDGIVAERLGRTARDAGLLPGARILAVDGVLAEAALADIPLALRSGSTPWQSRSWAAFHLLSTPAERLEVTYQNPGAASQTVTLVWPQEAAQPTASTDEPPPALIQGQLLDAGWGLIRIPTFSSNSQHDLVAEFDAALEPLLDTPGLILDLRSNGGGDTRLAHAIAGRFFEDRFCYGYDRFEARLPQRAWRLTWDYCVQPRGSTYLNPVVVLIDSGVMSTAEQFVVALVDSQRAITVGRQSGGASGNPVSFQLPGEGRARFSTAAFYRLDGGLIEGRGITPDRPVAYTVADFQAGRDPDLSAARQVLSLRVGEPDWSAISAYLRSQLRRHQIPGMAVAITSGDEIVYLQGFGEAAPGQPVTAQTPFYIGSLTKSFTALAVLQLVEAGQIDLDAPVQAYLPWFQVADPEAARQITVRHLLNQTSGLSYSGYRAPALPADTSLAESIRALKTAELVAPVGTRFQYFNYNYTILGLIIETVSGQNYSEYLQTHVFSPLAMQHTFTDPQMARQAGLAQGHNPFLLWSVPRPQSFLFYDLPAGFIIASAADLAHYLIAHNNQGWYGENQLLSVAGIRQLHTPVSALDSPYAMGWLALEQGDEQVIFHNGAVETYSSVMRLLPQQSYGIVLLTNQSSLVQIQYANDQIVAGLVDYLQGEQPEIGISSRAISAGLAMLMLLTLSWRLWRLAHSSDWLRTKLASGRRLWPGLLWQLLSPWLVLVGLPLVVYIYQGAQGTEIMLGHYGLDIFAWLVLFAGLVLMEGLFKTYLLSRFKVSI